MEISENNDKIVDVEYTQINSGSSCSECYTIDEVAKELGVDESKIVFWYNKFNYLLNIQSIGMYQIFDSYDMKNLRTIKRLNVDEKMDIDSIKEYFRMHNNAITIKENRTIGDTGLGVIDILAKIIESQNSKMTTVVKSNHELMEYNEKMINNQLKILKAFTQMGREIAITREEQSRKINELEKGYKKEVSKLSGKINELNSTLDKQQSELKDYFDSKEREAQKRHIEMQDMFKKRMDERKEKNNKGFFSRLFNKD